MISATEIKEIIEQVVPAVKAASLDNDAILKERGIDSLDMMSIILKIEETYKIKVADDEVDTMVSVSHFVNYVNKNAKLK